MEAGLEVVGCGLNATIQTISRKRQTDGIGMLMGNSRSKKCTI